MEANAMSILERFRLDGKVALVTGCRRGIGFAIAEGLAEAGADIVGVSYDLEPQGSKIEKAVAALGRSFRGYTCDFAKRAELHSFLDQVKANHPQVDILVNNAGTIRRCPAAEYSEEDWDAVVEVNLSAQFVISREIGGRMLAQGGGKIIFTASLLSFQGGITVPGYAASKGGVKQLAMALANEWAGQGVNVNAIAPGYITTDNTKALRADPVRSEQILGRIPAGRWGEPDDFKGPAVFLASEASAYCHGMVLLVDGGWMAR
jgi:2-deoxy-D-gluconate 3-dehydrogenase